MLFRAMRRKIARQTIADKFYLLSAVRYEIDDATWFEDGKYEPAKILLESYVGRMETTEDVIHRTVNSLSPSTRSLVEGMGSSIIETLLPRFRISGLPFNPAYTAHRELLRDLFGYDIMNMPTTDQSVADDVHTSG